MLDPMPDPDDCFGCKALREENARLKDLAADAEAGAKENAALLELSYRKRDSLTRERDAALTHGPEDMVRALEELTRERDDARAEVERLTASGTKIGLLEDMRGDLIMARAEVARLEGLILVGYKWLDPERPSNLTWDEGGPHETDAFEAEARRIRAQREGCRVCATKAVGLPTPGYTHDESCAQREKGE